MNRNHYESCGRCHRHPCACPESAPMTDPTPSTDARTAPVQPTKGVPFPTRVPWHFHERAWSQYAAAGHGRQSAERIAERCGFGSTELIVLLLGRDYNDQRSYETLAPEDVAKVRDEIEAWTSGQAALRAELTRLRDDIQADQHAQESLRAEVERLSDEVADAWAAIGVRPDDGDDSPEPGTLADAVRFVVKREREKGDARAADAWAEASSERDSASAALLTEQETAAALRARLADTEAERDALRASRADLTASHSAALAARAETEAALVGLRKAAEPHVGAEYATDGAVRALKAGLLDSAPLGARVIEAAREEGRAEERAKWEVYSEARIVDGKERYAAATEAFRNAERIAIETQASLATVTAERDAWARAADGLVGFDSEPRHLADAVAKLRAECDAALAKLAALEEAVGTVPHPSAVWAPSGRTLDRIRSALSLAPSTALAERDARVRKTALEEAKEAALAAYREHEPGGLFIDFATRLAANLASRGGGT